jgi:hypothetical protein
MDVTPNDAPFVLKKGKKQDNYELRTTLVPPEEAEEIAVAIQKYLQQKCCNKQAAWICYYDAISHNDLYERPTENQAEAFKEILEGILSSENYAITATSWQYFPETYKVELKLDLDEARKEKMMEAIRAHLRVNQKAIDYYDVVQNEEFKGMMTIAKPSYEDNKAFEGLLQKVLLTEGLQIGFVLERSPPTYSFEKIQL